MTKSFFFRLVGGLAYSFIASNIMAVASGASSSVGLRGNDDPIVSNHNDRRVLETTEQGIFLIGIIEYEDVSTDSADADGPIRGLRRLHTDDNSEEGNSEGHGHLHHETLNVQFDDGTIYELTNVDPNWRDGPGKNMRSGVDSIIIAAGAVMSGASIDLGGSEPMFAMAQNRRDLAALERRKLASGEKTVLAVRVVSSDSVYSNSAPYLRDKILGTNGDRLNLSSQYAACSYEKLTFKGAPTRAMKTDPRNGSTQINNGVVTVRINTRVSGRSDDGIRNAVVDQLRSNFGTSPENLADYVMLCLPPGTEGNWVAYAFVNSWMSIYNNQWCNSVSAQMHEIGHNLGLGHSGEDAAYDDKSGMMGFSYNSETSPKMCFNGAKSWQLGWYQDKSTSVGLNGDECFEDKLYGVADYGKSLSKYVVIKINDGGSTDHYVTFNRRLGINSESQEAGNLVTITRAAGEGRSLSNSQRVATLDAGNSYTVRANGKNFVVRVVSIPNNQYAQVVISENGQGCNTQQDDGICEDVTIKVDVRTDRYPAETSWTLANNCGTSPTVNSPEYGNRNRVYSNTYCLPPAQYTFEIKDSYGDGICCQQGNGAYAVTYDGEEAVSGGEFLRSQTTTFGSCIDGGDLVSPPTRKPTRIPTQNPTRNPTKNPTAPPTKRPTNEPTPVPTSEPTDEPTKKPTPVPTSEPTDEPTKKPTPVPSSDPTEEPTKKPTPVPTSEPTGKPTKEPTDHPISAPDDSSVITPNDGNVGSSSPTSRPTNSPTDAPNPQPTCIRRWGGCPEPGSGGTCCNNRGCLFGAWCR